MIGRQDVARDVIEALMLDRGLAREFTPGVLREAERARDEGLARAVKEVEQGRRKDLRGLATLTIDPAGAMDFDDAISAEQGDREGVVRVWVHIADVGAYVPEGSLVDREASRRGTSVYVPGLVEPMLPQALSNDACSLMPGQERAAVTVEMDVDLERAAVVRSAFYRSLIRSDERLDYERVDRIFAGHERAREPWGAPLASARAASAALGRARARAGGLVLDSEEPEIVFDAEGNVSEIRASAQTESHRLIEHLMIAANEAVAGRLAERKVGCLYRVHERPEPARIARLIEQLASLGVPTPPVPESMSPSQAAELMGEVSQRVERHVRSAPQRKDAQRCGPWAGRIALTSLMLRSLKQAYYSPRNIGHAGLHSACYCHFTSPIRRYPDLVCHRALVATLDGEQASPSQRDLVELGQWTSERERDAMRIERDADDIARCHALEQQLYEGGWEQTFTGEVAGLISAGAFVVFGGTGDWGRAGDDDGMGEAGLPLGAGDGDGDGMGESGQVLGAGDGDGDGDGGGDGDGVGESGRAPGVGEDREPRGPLYEGMLPVRRMRSLAGANTGASAGSSEAAGRRGRREQARAGKRGRRDGQEERGERDWWELNEHETILRGERSGSAIRLGDAIEIRVARVDTARGRVDLVPAG